MERLERDVLGSSGTSNRQIFVENLFSGSQEHYHRTLRGLNRTGSWGEASRLIAEQVFKKHQVNIYSPAAVMFTESVEAQFRRRG